jgi:hypothetical protein
MPASPSKVNLLPLSDFEQSFWGRFLKWAVTTGRYIIIVTELVVILAFLSRFKLDEDLRNLNDQINTQVGFLESQEETMNDFLRVQKKLTLVDGMLSTRQDAGAAMDYVSDHLPVDVVPSKRAFTSRETKITASTLNERAMGQLLSAFSKDPNWRSVDLTEILGDQTYGIRFTMIANK